MNFKSIVLAAAMVAAPAGAVTNLINNGSFEAGALGTGGFVGWTKTNTPSNVGADQPAAVIGYNNTNNYPTGAYGESVNPDNVASASPDAVGSQAAYFVGDFSVNETISQLTRLSVGNYRIGFSYYLTANGLANVNNSSFGASIIGTPVTVTAITIDTPGQTWFYATGVGRVTKAGYYTTQFIFNSNGFPAKDVVIDRVFAIQTNDAYTVDIPPNPTAPVPEPQTWLLLVAGFGLTGLAQRRRKAVAA